MSLLIHLPLVSNTENQGLLEVPNYSYNTLSQQDDGKIGIHCYNGTALYHFNQDPLGNEWSIALWFKKTDSWIAANDILLCKNNSSAGDCQFYFSIYNNGNKINLGINGSSSNGVGAINYSFSLNTWYHVAATYDGTNYAIYVNGVKISSGEFISTQYTGAYNLTINGRGRSSDGTDAYSSGNKLLNDVRIYNCALSEKKVKLLSQGLILHYPLDGNNGTLTNENLIIDSGQQVQSADSSNGSAYTGVNSHLFSDYGTELFTDNTTDEFTVSYDYEVVGAESMDGYSAYLYTQVNGSTLGTVSWVYPASANETGHFSFTTKLSASQAGSTTYNPFKLRFRLRFAVDGAYFIVKNVKLEKGTIATPWCPSSEDSLYTALGYNNNIEYDISGFCNNGEKRNISSYSTNSPRYLASTEFDASNSSYISAGTTAKVKDEITVSIWAYMDDWSTFTSTATRLFSCNQVGGWSIGVTSTSNANIRWIIYGGTDSATSKTVGATIAFTNMSAGWHMFTGTYDGYDSKLYIDGELSNTLSSPFTEKTPLYYHASNSILIGAEAGTGDTPIANTYFTGKLSDFRIYASCLSDTEIQKLYTVSASIDSNGNAYSAAYVEG